MKVKLYHCPATRSARVLWLLHELTPDVEVDVERVDLYAGDQYRPPFRDRFPLHAVPAVEITIEGKAPIVMTESGAIIVALADAHQRKGLAPATAPFSSARADYLRMIHACDATFDMMLWQVRIHEHVLNSDQRDERTIWRYRRKFETEVTPALVDRLSRSAYICGDRFTAADCVAGHVVKWAIDYGLCKADATQAYMSRLSERPAFRSAFADAKGFKLEAPDTAPVRALFMG